MLLFYGSQHVKMSTTDYTSTLAFIGVLTGAHIFCFLIIYQFRKNLVEERNIRRNTLGNTMARPIASNGTAGFEPSAPYVTGMYQKQLFFRYFFSTMIIALFSIFLWQFCNNQILRLIHCCLQDMVTPPVWMLNRQIKLILISHMVGCHLRQAMMKLCSIVIMLRKQKKAQTMMPLMLRVRITNS